MMMMKVVVIVERVIRTPIDSGDDFGDPSEDTDEMMSKMKIDKSWKQEIFVNNLLMYKDMITTYYYHFIVNNLYFNYRLLSSNILLCNSCTSYAGI